MKRTFTTAITAASTAIALLGMFGTKVLAQDAPNPNEVTIRNITYGGTGCPSNTVAASVSPDAKAFTLFFDQFVAQGGPGTTARDSYKVCNLSIDLRFPTGWTYSLVGVDYRGFAQLDPGVTGQQRSEYWIQGVSGRSIPLRSDIFGPYANDYRYSDRLGLTSVVWAPCGMTRALNVKASVAVVGANSRRSGLMTVDSIDGEVKHVYGIQWRRCR
jgi:hypothetical protein